MRFDRKEGHRKTVRDTHTSGLELIETEMIKGKWKGEGISGHDVVLLPREMNGFAGCMSTNFPLGPHTIGIIDKVNHSKSLVENIIFSLWRIYSETTAHPQGLCCFYIE